MTRADKIRQLTDEDLATFLVCQCLMHGFAVGGVTDRKFAEESTAEVLQTPAGKQAIDSTLQWLAGECDK